MRARLLASISACALTAMLAGWGGRTGSRYAAVRVRNTPVAGGGTGGSGATDAPPSGALPGSAGSTGTPTPPLVSPAPDDGTATTLTASNVLGDAGPPEDWPKVI